MSDHGVEPTGRPLDALYRPVVGLLSNDRDLRDSLRRKQQSAIAGRDVRNWLDFAT